MSEMMRTDVCLLCNTETLPYDAWKRSMHSCQYGWVHVSMHMACNEGLSPGDFGQLKERASPNGTGGQGGMVCDRCVAKCTIKELHEVLHQRLREWYIKRREYLNPCQGT